MQTTEQKRAPGEAAILSRVFLNGRNELPPELARYFLALDFSDADKARMHELAVRNQKGELGPEEAEELDSYRRAGYIVDLMCSKARLALKGR